MKDYIWTDKPLETAFPIAKPGYPYIGAAAFITLVLAIVGFKCLTVIGIIVTFCICGFFRDPDRVVPNKDKCVVSPADGKVIIAEMVESNPYIEGRCIKVSVFMSVFNVHVNRIPYDGKVSLISYHPGKFVNASLDKASSDNERNGIVIDVDKKTKIGFVQIAGLVARRIVCGLSEGDVVTKGRRFGLICFGSRLDVYLPEDTKLNVQLGDKVSAGTSILGFLQ